MCRYKAGDVLMVEPYNMPDTVSSFIELLHLNPDSLVTISTPANDTCESLFVAQWRSGRALDLRSLGCWLDSHWGQGCAATLGKLFTLVCLCHQAV